MSGEEIPQQAPQQEASQEVTEVIHVDLEDGEVKGVDKADKQGGKCDKKGKKSSKAWDFFVELEGCPEGNEKAKCKFCGVVIGCNTNRNGKPVSSVASEAAFSTGGRTIDAYRSSLSPKTAESLVCSQDWLRTSRDITDLRGESEEYLQFEKLENDELRVGILFQKLDIDD